MKALELADSISRMDTFTGYQRNMLKDAAAELRRLAAVETDCAQYLKEGETPAERIKRALGDADSLMNLYRDVMAERDQLRAARIAYASEFPPIPDGDDAGLPAVDRIHENIRRLKAERDALKAELEGRYQSIIEMGNMLTEIVNLIRGEPEEGTSHSTHDAVELVRGLAMHNDLYATAVELEVAKLKAENERLLAANRDCIAHYEDARAELERIKALPPVAWEVYVAIADNAYVVDSLDDPQLIDDCTNNDAVVTPLIALGSKP